MKRRVSCVLLVFSLCLLLLLTAFASGGSASDPVVSKSYVDGTFFKNTISQMTEKIENAITSLKSKYSTVAYGGVDGNKVRDEFTTAVSDAVLYALQSEGKYLYSTPSAAPKSLISGDIISAKAGTVIVVTEGSAKVNDGVVINITHGKEQKKGESLGKFVPLMFPEDGAKVEIISKKANVLIDGKYALSDGYKIQYMDEAYALKKLGLVRGAAEGMELYRGNTRAESITMLIRLLGEEESALAKSHTHPFGDVDKWAQNYVGYAYKKGYTKGVSKTRYDGSSLTTAGQYMTFVLRALGYSEEKGDFRYETALSDAVRLGVINQTTFNELSSVEFRRDHVMHISYLAMRAKVKGGNMTLLERLVSGGAVTRNAANEFLK